MSATLPGPDLSSSQYLFVMLHLQSLQLTSLRTFSLTLVLRLMKLNHKHTIKKNINPTLESSSLMMLFNANPAKYRRIYCKHSVPDWSN